MTKSSPKTARNFKSPLRTWIKYSITRAKKINRGWILYLLPVDPRLKAPQKFLVPLQFPRDTQKHMSLLLFFWAIRVVEHENQTAFLRNMKELVGASFWMLWRGKGKRDFERDDVVPDPEVTSMHPAEMRLYSCLIRRSRMPRTVVIPVPDADGFKEEMTVLRKQALELVLLHDGDINSANNLSRRIEDSWQRIEKYQKDAMDSLNSLSQQVESAMELLRSTADEARDLIARKLHEYTSHGNPQA